MVDAPDLGKREESRQRPKSPKYQQESETHSVSVRYDFPQFVGYCARLVCLKQGW